MTQLKLFGAPQQTLTTDDYYTPKWLFDKMSIAFDLDVASPPDGPPFVPCAAYLTQADDGLECAWHGRVWMNPPYSKPAPWVDRFIAHNHGVALLPFAKSKWCQALYDSTVKLVYLYAMAFYRPDRTVKITAPFSLGLWAFGDDCVDAIAKVGRVR